MADKNKKKKSMNSKSTIAVFSVLCVLLVAVAGFLVYRTYGDSIRLKLQKNKATAYESGSSDDGNVINITENLYVSWINEIATNTDDYLGKKIKIEGMYTSQSSGDKTYYYVYRNSPGTCPCCNSSMWGFEFTCKDGYPKDNDWIEVVGTLERYEEDGTYFLTLKDSAVTVKQERGAEYVVGN